MEVYDLFDCRCPKRSVQVKKAFCVSKILKIRRGNLSSGISDQVVA